MSVSHSFTVKRLLRQQEKLIAVDGTLKDHLTVPLKLRAKVILPTSLFGLMT